MIFSYFSKKIGFDISCKLSPREENNLHELLKPIFWENYINVSKCHLLKFLPSMRCYSAKTHYENTPIQIQ